MTESSTATRSEPAALAAPEPSEAPPAQPESALRKEAVQAWRASRDLGLSLLGTWSVALLVRFIVPRALGPADFGELNFAEVFAAGFMSFTRLGVDTYTAREISLKPKHASDFFAGVSLVRLLIAAVAGAIMLGVLAARDKPLTVQLTAVVFALNWCLTIHNETLADMLRASGSTGPLAVANVVCKICWGLGIAAALFAPGGILPLWVYATPALGSEVLKLFMMLPATRKAVDLRWSLDLAWTRRVLKASLPYFLGALATSLGGWLNIWVLDYVAADKRELGWYGAMFNLSSLAMIFTPLFGWVLLPMLSRASSRGVMEVGTILSYALEVLVLGIAPIVLIGCLGADLWIRISLGEAYLPGILAFQIVIVNVLLNYVSMVLYQGLVAKGHSWSLSSLSFVSLCSVPTLAVFLVPLFGQTWGVGGQAAGAALARSLPESLIVILAIMRMRATLPMRRLVRNVPKALAACFVIAALHPMLGVLSYGRLAVEALLYVVLLFLLRVITWGELTLTFTIIKRARQGTTL